MGTHLLDLPVEIRLHIYSYLHHPKMHLDFCKELAESRLPNSRTSVRASPLLSYLHKRKATSKWARDHGLHLLATNSMTLQQEFTGLLARSRTSLVIHCTACLSRLLQHLVRDLGVKTPVFKAIWKKVEMSHSFGAWSTEAETMKVIADIQDVIRTFYGRLDLLTAHEVPMETMRHWSVERVKVIGRLPARNPHQSPETEEHSLMINGDEDDQADEQDDPAMLHGYQTRTGVKELERRSKRWDVNMSDPHSRQRHDLIRAMSHTHLPSDDDQWRVSRSLRGDYKEAGKSAKRLVVREEVWVGMRTGL
ncbi:hypothetical protein LTR70_001907 [Exophiala xenobiotica]|uniref:Uncharacterized protein n=1 Tax=Lithohypha guttulata TaxID=1690604 RepID=A0ABR0KBG2_9EURO|nr:hypothetical protein LTR24_005091 [Lithohypha guttulata]KAK5326892.1 hypothetical protein LTR70_001907 [Exophiala xenobiotica]